MSAPLCPAPRGRTGDGYPTSAALSTGTTVRVTTGGQVSDTDRTRRRTPLLDFLDTHLTA